MTEAEKFAQRESVAIGHLKVELIDLQSRLQRQARLLSRNKRGGSLDEVRRLKGRIQEVRSLIEQERGTPC